MTSLRLCSLFSLLCFALTAVPASAATTGAVRGTITGDARSGERVADASVTLTSDAAVYRTTSDASGFYTVVGVAAGTYTLSIAKAGYAAASALVQIAQGTTTVANLMLHVSTDMRTIAVVSSRSSTFPVQRNESRDVYVATPLQAEQLGGVPGFENEANLLNALPGVTPVGGGSAGLLGSYPSIRGGLENDTGYQTEGLNITDPLTGQIINNFVINGIESIALTAGPGDASQGGSGSGYINTVTKIGTYPTTGYAQIEAGGPAYEHNAQFQFGTATKDHRYSFFASGVYDRDFGGCCAPPYGSVYGSSSGSYPDTNGQVSFISTNDTVLNAIGHFGKNDANQLQFWFEFGANEVQGGYGINPSTYPYTTATPQYVGIYQQAPLLLSNGALPPLTPAQAQALMPFYPGQTNANQTIGALPNEVNDFNLMKFAYSRAIGSRGFVNARVYRTQNWVVNESIDANDALFGYGLPTVGFGDFYVTRATQSTGVAADLQYAIGKEHELSGGFDYRFSRANLQGNLVSPSLFFGGPTIGDFLPANPILGGAPGAFYGQRYPSFEETITDPMHRTSLYVSDKWNPTDRILIQPGLRWDIQTVPTAAGLYEANQLQPRLGVVATIGADRATVLRASYGHAATFAPLFQIENVYTPPASYRGVPATPNLAICGGASANFSAPCSDYYDELYNAWWKGYGVNPYNLTKPQQSDTFDLSYEREFPKYGTGLKFTIYNRHDYDVIVNSQQVSFAPGGIIVPGTTAITNDGKAQTFGMELQLARQVAQGLSVLFNANYINQFVNYSTSNAFRPSVNPALLASGQMYHPSYFSPFTAAVTLDYRSHGWRLDPIVTYSRGYPVGTWGAPPVFLNGVPVNVPNTNLFNTYGNQYCYYTDPQVPGTPQNPNVVGSTGGGCTAAQNTTLTHPLAIFDLAIERELDPRLAIGLEIHNLFNNTANYPYYNPGYVNNGFGSSGPGSGTNPASGLPSTVNSYPSTPYFVLPSGPGLQYTFYLKVRV